MNHVNPTPRQRREAALNGPLLGHACANTERARRRDIAYFWAWCEAAGLGGENYPVDYAILAQFVENHLTALAPEVHQQLLDRDKRRKGALRVGTIRRMLSTLSVVHLALDEPSACRDPRLHYRLRAAKRQEAAPRKRRALTRDLLELVVDACGDDARGLRDRAILLVGWAAGGLRRSELCALDIESVRRTADGGRLCAQAHEHENPGGRHRTAPPRASSRRTSLMDECQARQRRLPLRGHPP
ncbi:integrase [Salinisphaera dokdonensis CL-ES53]|uniref:Integrase n=1 Tax=Salinisphaera dokdonensis CL-ES53 TaxID=1304272 RepID=A0ABV2B012_9GAMM